MLPLVGDAGRSVPEACSTTSSAEARVTGGVCLLEAHSGRWLGVVLCGGASRRMGRDKARLVVDGEPFYARVAGVLGGLCAEVVLASGPNERFGDPRWREIADARPGAPDLSAGHATATEGPLAALVAGLQRAAMNGFEGIVAAPCDVPRLAASALLPLQRTVAAHPHGAGEREPRFDVAHWRRGERDEPLCVALSVRALAPLAAAFERGVRRPTHAFAELRASVSEVPAELAEALSNVNTPAELARLGLGPLVPSEAHPGVPSGTNPVEMGHARMGDVA